MNCSRRASSKGFRRAVLKFLVREHALSEELRRRMLGWRYSGFSVHNQVCVAAEDVEGRKKLAGYMLRAPMSLEKMTYDAASGTVIQGGEGAPPFPRLEDAPGPEEELPGDARGAVARVALPAHPGSLRDLVRYVGWYSNRARGERAKALKDQRAPTTCTAPTEPVSKFAARARAQGRGRGPSLPSGRGSFCARAPRRTRSWPLQVSGIANRAIAGANYRKAQRLELAARLASAAGGGRARGERDRISYRSLPLDGSG